MTPRMSSLALATLASFAVATLCAPQASAKANKKQNNIAVNPLGVVLGGMSVEYTRELYDHGSINLRGLYMNVLFMNVVTGYGGEVSYLFWPEQTNTGAFVGPFAQVTQLQASAGTSMIGFTTFGPGVRGGYRWLWEGGFNLGLGGSLGYAIPISDFKCPAGASCAQIGGGVSPGLLFDLGYAF